MFSAIENVGSDYAIGQRNVATTNTFLCFETRDIQAGRYCSMLINDASDCCDVDGVGNYINRIYTSAVVNKHCQNIYFTHDCWNACEHLYYCISCKKCKHCFMCSGLIGKEYCIFNKQYTKEEYFKLVDTLIMKMIKEKQWGEFLPISLSPFDYTDTAAHMYIPLDASEIAKR